MGGLNGWPWRRLRAPGSADIGFGRLSIWDFLVACLAAPGAILLRFPEQIDHAHGREPMLVYSIVAIAVTIPILMFYRTGSQLTRYFSAPDALAIVKASALAAAITGAVLMFSTRLDNVSRTAPFIHFLLLAVLLLAGRVFSSVSNARRNMVLAPAPLAVENILLIGANHAAWLYIQLIDEISSGARRIVAVLDDRQKFQGRQLAGHIVVGSPGELVRQLSDFEEHGVQVDRIVVALPLDQLPEATRNTLEDIGQARQITVESLDDHVFGRTRFGSRSAEQAVQPVASLASAASDILARPYWRRKRALDVLVSALMLVAFSPIMVIVSAVVALHLGSPVIFWQQRLGRHGRPIEVVKLRSLRDPLDRNGNRLELAQRQTRMGRLLRKSKLDELPQLLNVLVGSMSLIGPRPLLPIDQPDQSSLRLLVAPGLTGWAQVCGGTLLTREEKGALDDWYVAHASAKLDARILLRTLHTMVKGEVRNEAAIARALSATQTRGAGSAPLQKCA